MKVKPQSKESLRYLRSGSKVHNMKLPGPPPQKIPKMSLQVDDLSLMKKSIDTSITNAVELLKVFQAGTPEIIETMKNECSMIYECKVCRNLFRSMANFITHKQNYCTTKFSMIQQTMTTDSEVLEHALIVGSEKGSVTSSRKTTRRDILSLLDNFQERVADAKQGLVFTEIPQSSSAVFNTTNSTATVFKDEGSTSKHTMVVGPTGHIVGSTQDGGATTHCKSCGDSIRDVETHIATCNSVFKQCFGCPLCSKFFTTTWAVYRHLRRLHGKNTEQVRRLRNLITKRELPVEQKLKKQTIIFPTQNSNNNEKGWLEELAKNGVDGMYKCYICKKKFERRAVLLSHMQMCEKRKPVIPVIDTKKTSSIPLSPSSEKQPTATIQVRVCYKKDGVSDKLADCRVVATRLTDEDTFAALTPLSNDRGQDEKTQKSDANFEKEQINVEGSDSKNLSMATRSKVKTEDDIDMQDNVGTIDNQIDFVKDNERIDQNGDIQECSQDPSQDIFGSQQISGNHVDINEDEDMDEDSRMDEDFCIPPSTCENDLDLSINPPLTNGFLSPEASSDKTLSAPTSSPEKQCNGWASLENDNNKCNFSSEDTESDNENNQTVYSEESEDMTPTGEVDDSEIDSSAITRIICGSVKPFENPSEDEYDILKQKDLEFDDANTISSEKPSPSISTELSYEFGAEQELEVTSENELDENSFPLNLYISKGDCVCLICNIRLSEKEALSHVSNHLGIYRVACGVPSCDTKTFFIKDLIEHINSEHKLIYVAALSKNLSHDEVVIPSSFSHDFHGFEDYGHQICDSHIQFFNTLRGRFGIDSLNDV